jgi:hypothetical protein
VSGKPWGRVKFSIKVAKECFDAGLDEEQVYLYAAKHVDDYCDQRQASGEWSVLKTRAMKDLIWDSVIDAWLKIKNDGKRVRPAYVSQGADGRKATQRRGA